MQHVSSRSSGGVLTVALTNPPFNFVIAAIVEELLGVLHEAEKDPGIGAIVIASGLERIFISHYDVDEILAGGSASPFPLGPRAAGACSNARRCAGSCWGSATRSSWASCARATR